MKTIVFSFLLISLNFFSVDAQAVVLNKLGERLSSCKNLENDDYKIVYAADLQREAKNLFTDDKLTTALVVSPDCYRVGTEIDLNLASDLKPYFGKALLKEIHVLNQSELLSSKANDFSKPATREFIRNNPAKTYGVLKFKLTQKIAPYTVTDKYKRLPTCFPSYNDWEAIRLPDDKMAKDIQSGKTKGLIWNGTFNCYKVGVYTEMILPTDNARPKTEGQEPESLGYIIPTELHVVHYTDLTNDHANLVGEHLSALKKKMEEKKDLEGGYVTLVGFDFEKVHPKDKPKEEEEQITTTN